MRFSPGYCLILLLLVNSACSGRVLWKIKQRVRKLQYEKAKQTLLAKDVKARSLVAHVIEGTIHQALDHFDEENCETFPQRFFINEAYWERPDGPVFLYIGGEGPISEFNVLAGHHVDMAEEHGALLVALEHRFYGDSILEDGLETENLGDLSSQQALGDIVEFHEYITKRFDLDHKNTWISFGGSYAGALSAWLRGKFPHLVYGAVASSAPVKAKLDFSTYNKIVGLSLMDEDVGGSEKCAGDVWEAFAAVEAQLMGGNATEVAKDFGCCEVPEDLEDQQELMQSLADIFMGTVEYNEVGAVLSIEEVCNLMTNQSEAYDEEMEAYDRLVNLVEIYRSTGEEPCLDASHEQTIEDLSETDPDTEMAAERAFLYQACTEFGWFPTCEDASCPFSRMLTLQSMTDLCTVLFEVPEEVLQDRIDFTNKFYGARHPKTHRVLYVNGGIDPWQELSVVDEKDNDSILIPDVAHCADMNPPGANDRKPLTQARQEIEKTVAQWLKAASWERMMG